MEYLEAARQSGLLGMDASDMCTMTGSLTYTSSPWYIMLDRLFLSLNSFIITILQARILSSPSTSSISKPVLRTPLSVACHTRARMSSQPSSSDPAKSDAIIDPEGRIELFRKGLVGAKVLSRLTEVVSAYVFEPFTLTQEHLICSTLNTLFAKKQSLLTFPRHGHPS